METTRGTPAEAWGTVAARAVLLAIAYLLVARLGFGLQVEPGGIAGFWPPSGMLLAALLLSPRRSWLWTLGAVAIADFASNVLGGRPAGLAVVYAGVGGFEAYLGARLFVRLCGEACDLTKLRQVVVFLVAAVFLPYAIGGGLAALATVAHRPDAPLWETAAVWLVSRGMGAAIVAPPLLTWLQPSQERYDARRVAEAGALLLSLGAICHFVFSQASAHASFPLFYLTFPPLVWSAVRFGPRGAATAILVVFAFALGNAYLGHALFVGDMARSVLWLQVYSLVVAASTLIVAAMWRERTVAQLSLAESEQMVGLAMDGANMGAWSWNVLKDELTWSDAVVPMFALDSVALDTTFEAFLDSLHPDDRESTTKAVEASLRDPENDYFIEHRVPLPDGTDRWLESRGRVYRDAAGRPVRMAGTVVDVTARKRARERERQLEAQLQRAQRLESVGLLAGGIAHDFNNLLQVILMSSNLLEIELAKSGAREHQELLAEVQVAGRRAADMTRSLLSFSRQHVNHASPVQLNPLIDKTLEMLRRLLPAAIEVSFRPARSLPLVAVQVSEMEQAIVNLCLNARDAMPEGGCLRISTRSVALDAEACEQHGVEPGRFAQVEVCDTGTGIESSLLDRIFDPFFTTREVGKGTGLGLSLVHAFVTRVGGCVEVESVLGEGTTLRVSLPVAAAPAREAPSRQPSAQRLPAEEPAPVAGTILVADDNDLVRKVAVQTLKSAGYTVAEACDGDEALAVFEKLGTEIDLVLIDGVMPRKSGREVYDIVSADHPDVPFIFSSGYTAGTLSEKFFASEKLLMLPKPYRLEELLSAVSELMAAGAPEPDA